MAIITSADVERAQRINSALSELDSSEEGRNFKIKNLLLCKIGEILTANVNSPKDLKDSRGKLYERLKRRKLVADYRDHILPAAQEYGVPFEDEPSRKHPTTHGLLTGLDVVTIIAAGGAIRSGDYITPDEVESDPSTIIKVYEHNGTQIEVRRHDSDSPRDNYISVVFPAALNENGDLFIPGDTANSVNITFNGRAGAFKFKSPSLLLFDILDMGKSPDKIGMSTVEVRVQPERLGNTQDDPIEILSEIHENGYHSLPLTSILAKKA